MSFSNISKNLTLRNAFLFCALILLPLLTLYFTAVNIAKENYLADIQKVKDDLELQNAKIEKFAQDKYQINDFLKNTVINNQLVKHSASEIKNFLERLDNKYPNAFKWLIWDEKGHLLPIFGNTILPGRKSWTLVVNTFIEKLKIVSIPGNLLKRQVFNPEFEKAMANIQKTMGGSIKAEHLNYARENPIDFSWFGKPCYAVWVVEPSEYENGYLSKINGGALIMVFPELLPKNIWMKRIIERRKTAADKLLHPILTINISGSYVDLSDEDLPQDSFFTNGIIDAYKNRSESIFEFNNYLAISTQLSSDDENRIISMANIETINNKEKNTLFGLRIFLLIFITGIFISLFSADWNIIFNISLRKRIAWILLTATFMPLLSLISIGKSFINHEEARLSESAYVKMRQAMEAMNLRYKDTPRITEKILFEELLNLVGKPPISEESIKKSLDQAIELKLIENYAVTNELGKISLTSWENLDPAIKRMFEMTTQRGKALANTIQQADSGMQQYIDEELSEIMLALNSKLDFSRPSFLRYYAVQDQHMYFMNIHANVDSTVRSILIQIPEHHLEKSFAKSEFKANRLATQDISKDKYELSFFSTRENETSFPEVSPLWTELKDELRRSKELKTEEYGLISVDNETFLYLIKPLSAMRSNSLLPCYIFSTNQISSRIKGVTLLLVSLSAAAVLGTTILSLLLASSLLVPIKQIDEAAQRVGTGDLNVLVPEMGEDEMGRLSKTFNEMVKGLREHKKMQAYVSDSVREAIQENDSNSEANIESLRNGKNIEATILFSDIRNFTGITEQNPPEKVFNLLNEFLGGVEPIIRMNHGRVDKYIGDAVMAVFHHTSPEHHALSAIKTSVMMMKFLKKMNTARKKQGLFPINIGIGISTGTVLLGDVGSAKRKDLTVIGDEVNLASRLESASKKGRHSKTIFSGSTYKLIKDYVNAEKMPFSEVRGKEQNIEIYELINLKNKN
ncbi:MAG: adenylate/guanylate cyclase domain-containing protein [Candidatus Riflebacteria bacterium]|nr:adenylate/guanylate cyclase domain-containing protein [Candidatus Riflebacteria bacterium]